MDKTEALAQLKDIHLPPPIHWWPLAPGWYLLILLMALFTAWSLNKLYRRYLRAQPKRMALKLLAEYQQSYEKDKNSQMTSARLSELLRRVALAYYPRSQVASLKGEAWIEFLNQSAKNVDFRSVKNMLLELPFQSKQKTSLKPLFTRTEAWIKQQGGSCSN